MNDFLLFLAVCLVVMYPVHGACMYGKPWTWIFKDSDHD